MASAQVLNVNDRVERRVAPRFSHELHTWIGGRRLRAGNFSLTGMQIVLKARQGLPIDPTGAVEITIDFPSSPLLAKGRVIYVSEDDDECLLGLDFTEFQGNGGHTWRNFCDVHEKHAML